MAVYDREQVIGIIRKLKGKRSLRVFALDMKLSAAYLSDVFRGNRDPGPRLLKPLHLEKIKEVTVRYQRIPKRAGK